MENGMTRRSTLVVGIVASIALLGGPGIATAQERPAATKKTVLITGASSGFGRATTERLAAKGHFVYAGARKQEDLDALNALKNVKALRLDVTSQPDIDAAVAQVAADGRGLDGLVNNAGVAILFPLNEVDEADLKYLFDVNIWGPWRVTKAFAPMLIASKGRVVNLSSISGIFAAPLLGPYSMSKHAVEAYSEALRGEMAKFGVTVATIEPGNFATEIGQTAYERMQARGQTYKGSPFEAAAEANMERLRGKQGKEGPERVAKAIEHALLSANPRARYLVVSNQRDAEVTIRSSINKLTQLNQAQPFAYDRDKLVEMLDKALAPPPPAASKP
jgi:NAD(P)-dependent dehydrogenase (short-subunit alcohol dehydrogenase family)